MKTREKFSPKLGKAIVLAALAIGCGACDSGTPTETAASRQLTGRARAVTALAARKKPVILRDLRPAMVPLISTGC